MATRLRLFLAKRQFSMANNPTIFLVIGQIALCEKRIHLRSYFRIITQNCIDNSVFFTKKRVCTSLAFYSSIFTLFKPKLEIGEGNIVTTEKEIVHKIALAKLALEDGNTRKAKEILLVAVKLASQSRMACVGVPCVYDMLATIAYSQGEIYRAEELLIEAIDLLVHSGLPEWDNQIVNFNLKLSKIYAAVGEDFLSELGYKNCVEVQQGKVVDGVVEEDSAMLLISVHFWYGMFLQSRGRYNEARDHFEEAYAMSAHTKSILSSQLMVILYHLSEVTFAAGDMDSTLKHLLSAVVLGRGSNHPDLPLYYAKIGVVYLHKGAYDQAKAWCSMAKRVATFSRNIEAEGEANSCLQKLINLESDAG